MSKMTRQQRRQMERNKKKGSGKYGKPEALQIFREQDSMMINGVLKPTDTLYRRINESEKPLEDIIEISEATQADVEAKVIPIFGEPDCEENDDDGVIVLEWMELYGSFYVGIGEDACNCWVVPDHSASGGYRDYRDGIDEVVKAAKEYSDSPEPWFQWVQS